MLKLFVSYITYLINYYTNIDLPNELCDRTVNHFFNLFNALSLILLSLLANSRAILISCAMNKFFLLSLLAFMSCILLLILNIAVTSFFNTCVHIYVRDTDFYF